jgi:hypothetical protein
MSPYGVTATGNQRGLVELVRCECVCASMCVCVCVTLCCVCCVCVIGGRAQVLNSETTANINRKAGGLTQVRHFARHASVVTYESTGAACQHDSKVGA